MRPSRTDRLVKIAANAGCEIGYFLRHRGAPGLTMRANWDAIASLAHHQ
jgi:hypothetical protein